MSQALLSHPALAQAGDPRRLPETQPDDGGGVPLLLQLWHMTLRRKWVAIGIVGAALLAGLVLTMLMTPQYRATARLEISREQKKVTNVEGVETNEEGRDLEFYQTQYALLEARSLAERVERTLRLGSNDAFFRAHGVNLQGSFFSDDAGVVSPAERARRSKIAVNLLLKNVLIGAIPRSRLVDVSYQSASPEISAMIANAWTKQFVQATIDRRFSSTADARQFLEKRLSELRASLERSERDLVGYANVKDIVTLSKNQSADGRTTVDRTLVTDNLDTLNKALAEATTERISAGAKLNADRAGSQREALTNTAISGLRQRRAELAAEQAKLLVQFEPGYPAVQAIREQIATLDKSIAREEGRVGQSATSDYQAAAAREQELRAAVDTLKSRLAGQNRDAIQYNNYQREADTNRQLYDSLLQRFKEIGVASIGANNIAIVDPAEVPQSPASPNLPLNMVLALLVGIALAGGVLFALEQIDEGLREPGQVQRQLAVPLLGSVPHTDEGDALAQLTDVKSQIAEAYLSIRSNLAFSTDHGVPRTFMVTSTRAAEGKSTTSFALASVLSRLGRKVILIDADMRSPSVHHIVGIDNARGLSNYLAGESDLPSLIHEAGAAGGLSILSAGPTPPSASELLSSDRVVALIQALAAEYDHVVIDSPPILGLADAPLLSRAVEGCIMVVEADGVAVRGVKASLNRLRAVNAHLYGVIITKLKDRHAGYGYGYGYGYRYGDTAKER